jgi:hypothetical protein
MERSNEMKMVVTHEVENVEKWLENRNERHGTISKFAENIVEYVIDSGSNVVALTFTITDEQKMTDIMQDENTRLEMIRHGVKPETNNTYIER